MELSARRAHNPRTVWQESLRGKMMKASLRVSAWALGLGLLLAGCSSKKDVISQAGNAEASRPSLAETKDIAEQGFIFGLPLVTNYAAMNAYSINTKSPAYTAPFNVIKNEARVYTPKDRAVPLPNSDTPYSVLFMDLRAEPIVLSVP